MLEILNERGNVKVAYMEQDCGFTRGDNYFRYRTAAIIIENDCVLLATNSKEKYYYSVGGGVHINEQADEAIKREVFEETGVNYEIDRLAVIHENFFDGKSGVFAGLHCHEVAFYYLMKPRGTQELNSNSYTLGVREEMKWIPIKDLDNYEVYPTFLKEYLATSHIGIKHIVTIEQ